MDIKIILKTVFLVLLVSLYSCSAEWHLKRAIHKNPKYGDSSKTIEMVIFHDTIYDTIHVPSHDFSFTVDSLRNCLDSFSLVYNDSFITIHGKLDSLGQLKFKGTIKEKLIPYYIEIHDTAYIEKNCPPNITVQEGYPKWYLWVLLIITIFVIILALRK